MMRKYKTPWLLLLTILLLLFSLTGCGDKEATSRLMEMEESAAEEQTPPEEPEKPEEPEEPEPTVQPEPEDPALSAFRQQLQEDGYVGAILEVGFFSGEAMDQGFRQLLEDRGYLSDYPFLETVPREQFVRLEGEMVYCLIPADAHAETVIYEQPISVEEAEAEPVYTGDGTPVFFRCDIMFPASNVHLDLTLPDGRGFRDYMPTYKTMAGEIHLPQSEDGTPLLLDGTKWPVDQELLGQLVGTWKAEDLTDANGAARAVCFTFGADGFASYYYGPPYSDIFEYLEGTWSVAGEDNADGAFRLEMVPISGALYADGIPDFTYAGTFETEFSDDGSTLTLYEAADHGTLFGQFSNAPVPLFRQP